MAVVVMRGQVALWPVFVSAPKAISFEWPAIMEGFSEFIRESSQVESSLGLSIALHFIPT